MARITLDRPAPSTATRASEQQDRREGEEHVHGAHDDAVHQALVHRCDSAEEDADPERDCHGAEARSQRGPAAVQHAAEHVPAELIGTQPVSGPGAAQRAFGSVFRGSRGASHGAARAHTSRAAAQPSPIVANRKRTRIRPALDPGIVDRLQPQPWRSLGSR